MGCGCGTAPTPGSARPADPLPAGALLFPDRDVTALDVRRLIDLAQSRVRSPVPPVAPPGPGTTRRAEPATGIGPVRQPRRWSRRPAPLFSVIIPSRDEGEFLTATVQSVLASEGPAFEVIVVDDGSRRPADLHGRWPHVTQIEGPGLGVAPARNLGAASARGRYLVFIDAHVEVPPDWLERVERAFAGAPGLAAVSPGIASYDDPRAVGFGLTWDDRLRVRWLPRPDAGVVEVPLLPGGCLAVRKAVFDRVGGFNRGFRGHGYDDQEFSLRLWLMGHRLGCLRDVVVLHRFRTDFPYPVDPEQSLYNLLRMALSHFGQARLARVLSLVQETTTLAPLMARLLTDDTLEDRRRWLAVRLHDDDWFMRRFAIPF